MLVWQLATRCLKPLFCLASLKLTLLARLLVWAILCSFRPIPPHRSAPLIHLQGKGFSQPPKTITDTYLILRLTTLYVPYLFIIVRKGNIMGTMIFVFSTPSIYFYTFLCVPWLTAWLAIQAVYQGELEQQQQQQHNIAE